ncbi:GntR family transcriptional regulator [Nocardia sp. NPDC003345]
MRHTAGHREHLDPAAAAREGPIFRDQVRRLLPTSAQLTARRLRDLLRAELRAGAFGSGRLPGESELMSRHRASRDSVRAALDLLRRDGLIERRRGLGTVPIRDDHVVAGALPPRAARSNSIWHSAGSRPGCCTGRGCPRRR